MTENSFHIIQGNVTVNPSIICIKLIFQLLKGRDDLFTKGAVHIENIKGHRMDPCGTPYFKLIEEI